MGRASGGSKVSYWIRNDIPDSKASILSQKQYQQYPKHYIKVSTCVYTEVHRDNFMHSIDKFLLAQFPPYILAHYIPSCLKKIIQSMFPSNLIMTN